MRSRDIVHRLVPTYQPQATFLTAYRRAFTRTLSIGLDLPSQICVHTEERVHDERRPTFLCVLLTKQTVVHTEERSRDIVHWVVPTPPYHKHKILNPNTHKNLSIQKSVHDQKICATRRAFTRQCPLPPDHKQPTILDPPPLKHKRAFTTTNQTKVHTEEERSRKQCPLGCTYLFGTTPPTYIYIYIYIIYPLPRGIPPIPTHREEYLLSSCPSYHPYAHKKMWSRGKISNHHSISKMLRFFWVDFGKIRRDLQVGSKILVNCVYHSLPTLWGTSGNFQLAYNMVTKNVAKCQLAYTMEKCGWE